MPSLSGAAIAARARSFVGTRFRPQGRSPEYGLDCVGLVALAAQFPPELVPSGYSMRSEAGEEMLSSTFGGRAERIRPEDAGEGDVLLVSAGAGQHHLLLLLEHGFVHADAGLGKIVERPGAVPWRTVCAWRSREVG